MQKYDIFYCYSFKLAYFIKSQGIDYLYKNKNKRNQLTYYAFQKSDDLNNAIELWNKLKSKEDNLVNELWKYDTSRVERNG